MRDWGNKGLYEGLTETQKWECKLFGYYAEKLLLSEYDEGVGGKGYDLSVRVHNICHDGRRKNTVHKKLAPHLGPFCVDDLKVKHESFEEHAPQYAQEPWFDLTGAEEKRTSYGTSTGKMKPLEDSTKAYRKVKDLTTREAIYVWHHQDDYLFEVVERKEENYRTASSRVYHPRRVVQELKLFPKTKLDEIETAIFDARVEQIICEHPEIAVPVLYGVNMGPINDKNRIPMATTTGMIEMDDFNTYQDDKLTSRIADLARVARVFRRACKSLVELRRQLRIQGFDKVDAIKKMREHFLEEAPLYVNSDNERVKSVAKEMLKTLGKRAA